MCWSLKDQRVRRQPAPAFTRHVTNAISKVLAMKLARIASRVARFTSGPLRSSPTRPQSVGVNNTHGATIAQATRRHSYLFFKLASWRCKSAVFCISECIPDRNQGAVRLKWIPDRKKKRKRKEKQSRDHGPRLGHCYFRNSRSSRDMQLMHGRGCLISAPNSPCLKFGCLVFTNLNFLGPKFIIRWPLVQGYR
jgi:hypothetical protein